ncbi:MAG TPA: HEAT repeat domain-containing protein [Longimicrobiales bacterium]|nr:HEAT repeat domain-containing protein [Longimicrobiales bacterium]
MTSRSGSHELRGLARTIHELFARDAQPSSGGMDGGHPVDPRSEDVAWVAESGVRLPGDVHATDPLISAVRAYVGSVPEGREFAADAVRAAAADARDRRAAGAMADAAEALARFAEQEPGALELALPLVTPGVATLLVARVGEAGADDGRRAELVEALPLLGEEVEVAVLEALRAEALDRGADRGVRRAYLAMVSRMADRGSGILDRMLEDPDWRVMRNGIHLVGERGDADAVSRLKAALGHDDPRVRKEVLVTLAKLGGDDVGVLAKVHLEDPDPAVRAQAVRTVGVLHVELALRPLLALLDREEEQDVILEAIRSLGLLGDVAAVPTLDRLASPSLFARNPQEVRVAAYRALGAIGSPRTQELIQEALADKDPEVRRTAETLLQGRDE